MPARALPVLAAANFAAATAGMLVAGVLQLIALDLGWSPARAGQLIILYALAFAVGAPLLGAVFAQACRKHLVVYGLAVVGLGSFATALAGGTPWLESARVVVAAGAAVTLPSTSAVAAHLYPGERSRALAYVLAGLTVAIVVGLPLGTFLAGLYGWRVPMLAAGVLALLAAVMVKRLLPGGIFVPPVALATWTALLASPRAHALLAGTVLSVGATFALYAYVAPFLADALDYGARALALLLLWFGLAGLAVNQHVAALEARVGRDPAMVGTLALQALAIASLALAPGRPWVVVLAFGAWSASTTWFSALQQSRLYTAAGTGGPALLALNTSAVFVGQALGTLIGAATIAAGGVRALPLAAAGVAALAAVAVRMSRRVQLDGAASPSLESAPATEPKGGPS